MRQDRPGCKRSTRRLHVPFAIGDANNLDRSGLCRRRRARNLILKLVMAADYDIASAERGSFAIDEIDKIGKTSQNCVDHPGRLGRGHVQQALLKLLEAARSPTCRRRAVAKHPEQQYLRVDTTDILFICGGTFVGLDEIIGKRLGKEEDRLHTCDSAPSGRTSVTSWLRRSRPRT